MELQGIGGGGGGIPQPQAHGNGYPSPRPPMGAPPPIAGTAPPPGYPPGSGYDVDEEQVCTCCVPTDWFSLTMGMLCTVSVGDI